MSLRLLSSLALALVATSVVRAQSIATSSVSLSGRIVDSASRAPVPYATVQLLRERDTSFVTGRLSDSTGAFVFSGLGRGSYLLSVRTIGYAPTSQRVLVGELSTFLDVGTISLVRTVQTMTGVLVTGSADGVSETMDRRSINVADNVSQTGGSVLQAMSTVPGVTVTQDGKVLLRGSDKVVVLIDGKQTALTGFGSQVGLQNLPASALERIEIITNPSARYDANASAGVINLVLRQEERRGFTGRVGVVAGAGALWEKRENLPTIRPQYRMTPKFNPSVALNYRSGSGTNSFLRLDWLHASTLNKNEFATRRYDDGTTIVQQVKRNRDTDYATLNFGVDHEFSRRNTLRVSGLFNQETIIDRGDNPYFDETVQNRQRLWQFLEDEVLYTASGTAAFEHRFPQAGHTLSASTVYSFHREDEKYFFTNTLPGFVGEDAFALIADEYVVDLSLDYVRPLRSGRFEGGLKGRYRSIPVDMRFFPGENSPIDSGAGGWAKYRERIPALYGNYVYESERIELEGGVRLEATRLNYDVNPDHNTYRSDGYQYFQPFPNVRVAYKFSDAHKLSFFVNRRVDRPNEGDIRIFPKYDEPELIKVGNPALQPQFTTSLELGFKTTWGTGSLYAAAVHRIVDGTIARIATQVAGSPLLYNVSQNAGRSTSTGAELVWQQSVTPTVQAGANAAVFTRTIDRFSVVNQYPEPTPFTSPRQQTTSGSLKATLAVLLPRAWQLQTAGVYLAPDLFPQGRVSSRAAVDIGLKKVAGRGEFIVNATDVLNTNQSRRTVRGADFRIVSRDYLETQVLRVGYTLSFR